MGKHRLEDKCDVLVHRGADGVSVTIERTRPWEKSETFLNNPSTGKPFSVYYSPHWDRGIFPNIGGW